MLPARFIPMAALPRTRNGKLDRAALLTTAEPTSRRPPNTARQQDLATLWTEVLGITEITLDDDFFSLGGHSLSVTRLVSRIRDKFQIDLPLRAVFEAPTLEALDQAITALAASTAAPAAEPPLVARRRDSRKPLFEGKEA
jgi:acyl carrier protein